MDGTITPLQRFLLAFVAFFYVLFSKSFAEGVKLIRERQKKGLPPAPPGGSDPVPAGLRTIDVAPSVPVTASRSERSPDAARPEAARPESARPIETPGPPAPPEPEPPPTPGYPSPIPPPEPTPTVTASPSVVSRTLVSRAAAPDHAEALHVLAILQRDGRLLDFLSESLDGFSDSEIGAAARTVHSGCKKVLESYLDVEPVLSQPEGASVTVPLGFDPASVRLTGNVVGAPPFKGSLRHHGWRATRTAFPPPPAGADACILAPAEVEL